MDSEIFYQYKYSHYGWYWSEEPETITQVVSVKNHNLLETINRNVFGVTQQHLLSSTTRELSRKKYILLRLKEKEFHSPHISTKIAAWKCLLVDPYTKGQRVIWVRDVWLEPLNEHINYYDETQHEARKALGKMFNKANS